ncbi:MAG: chitinase [Bacillota bacterium]|nr:chitinase [Bacillota bacterium]
MKKTNISKFAAVGLCICALTGCGASPDEKPDTPNPVVNSNTNEENINGSSENKGDVLESANLIGDVLEFTEDGCLLNQAKETDGGAGLQMEAPGMENKDNAVSVTYNPDCEFVIATLSKQSGSVTNVTTGSVSDVKKQSSVYLYGEFTDTNHFNATKVVIARWE